MAELKTKPTDTPVAEYLDRIEDLNRRADCEALIALMTKITGCAPVLWGPSIVGFDSYHYKYASGHEGNACVAGFSVRKDGITVYLMAGFDGREEQLARLGKHKTGKACLYLKGLDGVDLRVLEALVAGSVAEIKRLYPGEK